MANEITARAALLITKNGIQSANDFTEQSDLTGNAFFSNVQTIGISAEPVFFGDLGSANIALFQNLDPANYVELALDVPATAQVFVKLNPKAVAIIPLKTLAIYAKANAAAVNLFVQAVEV